MEQPQINYKSVFIEAPKMSERYYCNNCLYGNLEFDAKFLVMRAFPKPQGTKCYIGSSGYYIEKEV